MSRRRSSRQDEPDEFEEFFHALIHLSAAYPWIGCVLGVVLVGVSVPMLRAGSYYPIFGALAELIGVLLLIAAGFGAIARRLRPGIDPRWPLQDGAAAGNASVPAIMPYRPKPTVLSRGELAFFDVLRHVAGRDDLILVKVRLADLLEDLPRQLPRRSQWLQRIAGKHVDFVICDRQTSRPFLVIELDDGSHQRPSRAERDRFVDQVLASVKLPLRRFPCAAAYDPQEIAAEIRRHGG